GRCTRVRTGEDRRGRLALQLLDREARIVAPRKPVRPRLDERTHERPVLVQRRPVERRVLLERERQLRAVVEVREQDSERAEAERAERAVEVRGADRHAFLYFAGGPSPLWQSGHQYAIRAVSPCGHDWMNAPQRGHGLPFRR